MADVKFLCGLASNIPETREELTFYWTTDTKELFLGNEKINGGGSEAPEIPVEQLEELKKLIGNLADLTTSEKTDLVSAVNELVTSISNAAENSKVTLEESEDSTGSYAKKYIVKQGGEEIGVVNIPKDMIISSGEVVDNTDGSITGAPSTGKFIVITLNDASSSKIYIPVSDLVTLYKVEAEATQVQLAISDDNTISAKIKENSITALEMGIDSILTVNIKDGNVTAAKLATDVKELFDEKGTAETKLEEAKTYTDTAVAANVQDVKAYADELVTWGRF